MDITRVCLVGEHARLIFVLNLFNRLSKDIYRFDDYVRIDHWKKKTLPIEGERRRSFFLGSHSRAVYHYR
jgi:hypothetical protein